MIYVTLKNLESGYLKAFFETKDSLDTMFISFVLVQSNMHNVMQISPRNAILLMSGPNSNSGRVLPGDLSIVESPVLISVRT